MPRCPPQPARPGGGCPAWTAPPSKHTACLSCAANPVVHLSGEAHCLALAFQKEALRASLPVTGDQHEFLGIYGEFASSRFPSPL